MDKNRTDLELITSLVDKNSRILDVGCGNGELLKSLKQKKNIVFMIRIINFKMEIKLQLLSVSLTQNLRNLRY